MRLPLYNGRYAEITKGNNCFYVVADNKVVYETSSKHYFWPSLKTLFVLITYKIRGAKTK